jgi:IS30 family transposase
MTKKYNHLTLTERIQIEIGMCSGLNPTLIAARLDRPTSCISRELKRNRSEPIKGLSKASEAPQNEGVYSAQKAQERAHQRAHKPRVSPKLVHGNALWQTVEQGLRNGLSPEQIAGAQKRMDSSERLCHETIYQAIYIMPRGALRTEMIDLLRFGHKKRQPRARGDDRRGHIPNMVSIDDRPAEVAGRQIPGHWEGDHIKGAGNKSQVGTMVERKSRFVCLVKLANGTAAETARGFGMILQRFDVDLRRSLTYDQGREMAQHALLTAETGINVYFAHPHSPWERGQNENTNGLLRQYLPKGTDLSVFSQAELDEIAWKLNTRPRKSLGWKCPAELFLPDAAFDFKAHWREILNPSALVN